MSAPAADAPAGRRRALRLAAVFDRRASAVLAVLAVSAALLVASRATWVDAVAPAGPGTSARPLAVGGADAAALVPALALVGVAGALALSTVRGVGRLVASALVALAGAGAAASALAVLLAPARAARGAVRDASGLTGLAAGPASVTAWPVVALVLSLVLAACAVAVAVRGRRWTTSARFEVPTGPAGDPAARPARRPSGAASRAVLWDELSRGGDPTAPGGADREPPGPAAAAGGMMEAEPAPPSQPSARPPGAS